MSVSSGIGRNGPWLQNRWVRAESRLDDASIAPVALAGAFRPLERAIAFAELDAGRIDFHTATYDVQPHEDDLGAGRRLTLTSRRPRERVTLRREVVLYDDSPLCAIRLGATNDGAAVRRVDALHPLATPASGRGRWQYRANAADVRVYRHGWQSWSPTMSLGGADVDLRSRVPDLAPEPAPREPGRFASDDVCVLYDPEARRSLLVGAISGGDFITQVRADVPAKSLDVVCFGDGVPLAPGETVWSERIAVDVCGTPNEQLERYGDALGRTMHARVPSKTPSGWCSWYYFFTQVTEDDVVRNLRFLEQHRRAFPIDTVQIDDGYQADIGDWLTVNEKFPSGMGWLAGEIKRGGYTPGIWLAPFLLAESSETYAAHADWVVRGDDGQPVVACDNWQRRNYGIDGSNEAARAWLRDLFGTVCDDWGYDYVKIDFLYGAAVAGQRQDAAMTRARAYRDALAAVREGVGERRFILGCGALMAPSVGVFDGNRIGPDVAPFWRYLTTEERARPRARSRLPDDPLSAETAIRNTMTRSWMHGRLWANDPDCALVRTDRTKLTLEEVRSLVSAIGLSGGMALSSDDLAKLPPDRLEILSMLLPPLPRSASPFDLMTRDMPEQFVATFDRAFDPVTIAGLFNFDDEAKDVEFALPEGRWHAYELWGERYLGVIEKALMLALVEPHGCRVVALRRDDGEPRVVGTNAHIGAGAIDITNHAWDAGAGLLRVELAAVGRRERRIVVFGGGGSAGRAEYGGQDVAVRTVAGGFEVVVTVDEGGELVVALEA